MILAIDFDSTIVKDRWPGIGVDAGALYWMKKWQKQGVGLVLNTLRTYENLRQAVDYLTENEVYMTVIRKPTHHKVYSDYIIDDRAIGTPLLIDDVTGKPYVDWSVVGPIIDAKIAAELLNEKEKKK